MRVVRVVVWMALGPGSRMGLSGWDSGRRTGQETAWVMVQARLVRARPRLSRRRRLRAAIRVCSHQSLAFTPW